MITRSIMNMTVGQLVEHLLELRDAGLNLAHTQVFVRNPAGDHEPLEAVSLRSRELFLETHADYVPGGLPCRGEVGPAVGDLSGLSQAQFRE